jgi:G:T-mismatch repair DNA endonuclease (very short patch repair protein)
MHNVDQDTMEKPTYLKDHGYNMVKVWECQIKREMIKCISIT